MITSWMLGSGESKRSSQSCWCAQIWSKRWLSWQFDSQDFDDIFSKKKDYCTFGVERRLLLKLSIWSKQINDPKKLVVLRYSHRFHSIESAVCWLTCNRSSCINAKFVQTRPIMDCKNVSSCFGCLCNVQVVVWKDADGFCGDGIFELLWFTT